MEEESEEGVKEDAMVPGVSFGGVTSGLGLLTRLLRGRLY